VGLYHWWGCEGEKNSDDTAKGPNWRKKGPKGKSGKRERGGTAKQPHRQWNATGMEEYPKRKGRGIPQQS